MGPDCLASKCWSGLPTRTKVLGLWAALVFTHRYTLLPPGLYRQDSKPSYHKTCCSNFSHHLPTCSLLPQFPPHSFIHLSIHLPIQQFIYSHEKHLLDTYYVQVLHFRTEAMTEVFAPMGQLQLFSITRAGLDKGSPSAIRKTVSFYGSK